LLFHAGGPWTPERQAEWVDLIRRIERTVGYAIVPGRMEVTTRVLCDAIRAVLREEEEAT
jgi:hypothetical protein